MEGWNSIFSDLFVNLAAGWFGAILIVPNFAKNAKKKKKYLVLFVNFLAGILCLVVAYLLRRL